MFVSFYGERFYRVFTYPAHLPPPRRGKADGQPLMDIKSPSDAAARQ
jgi:hypothetical protein